MNSLSKIPQMSVGLGDVFDSDLDLLTSKEFTIEDLYLPVPTSICETLEELGTPHTLARNLGALYLSRAFALRELSLLQFDTAFPADRTFLLDANSLKLKVFKGLLKATLEHRYSVELSHHQETIIQLAGVWTSDDEQTPVSVRRSSFTKNTIDTLQALYDLNQYPNPVELKTIAVKVGLQPKQIRAWFQNRRNRRLSPAQSQKKTPMSLKRKIAASDLNLNTVHKRRSRGTASFENEQEDQSVPSRLGSPISLQTEKASIVPDTQGRLKACCPSVADLFDTPSNDQDASTPWSTIISDGPSIYASFEQVPQIESSLPFAIPEPADLMSVQIADGSSNVSNKSFSSHPVYTPALNLNETTKTHPVDWRMVFAKSNSRSLAPRFEEVGAQLNSKMRRGIKNVIIDVSPITTTER